MLEQVQTLKKIGQISIQLERHTPMHLFSSIKTDKNI